MIDIASSDPSLADFLAQHATPYDPTTDTYRWPLFAVPVKAGKNTAIYNAHSYHTKVPPLGITPYIEHYTEPRDLVLDPFCGSGMTGVASLMDGRHAILNDLSPAAVHITRNYCTPVDVAALRQEFERIKAAVQDEFDWLYGTTCDRCGGPATIQSTLWSDVFECGRGGELVVWGPPDRTGQQATVIDVVQAAASLWEHGDRAGLNRFLTEAVFGCEGQLRLITQILVHVLPDDDPEHRLPEMFLAGRELLAEQPRQERLL